MAMDNVDFEKQEQQLHQRAATFRKKHKVKSEENNLNITNDVVDIFSDGVRMSATVWKPLNIKQGQKLPAVLLCHGWGGKRGHLDFSYASRFAAAGFVAVTFDYRTWGESDPIYLPTKTGEFTKVRKVIDPEWQLRDALSALTFTAGLDSVDKTRIAVWGSSFGSGHVLALAARKPHLVKCLIAQIGSLDTHANWINRHPVYRGQQGIENLELAQVRGEIFPWTVDQARGLDGSPNLPKIVFEHAETVFSSISKIKCPVQLLAAEGEELFDNDKNTVRVFNMLRASTNCPRVEIDYLPGKHYDAYNNPAYKKGVEVATEWIKLYLANPQAKI